MPEKSKLTFYCPVASGAHCSDGARAPKAGCPREAMHWVRCFSNADAHPGLPTAGVKGELKRRHVMPARRVVRDTAQRTGVGLCACVA
eukprot:6203640-Pleurochrysis_carterae.AAC.3